jgi:hypothetical protein
LTTSRRPSPALVLSMIALFVALGGVSYGLAGKNTVTSDDIVNGAVKSKDLKNSGVKSKDLNTGSVKTSDVADDALTGDDINENTLNRVPEAGDAATLEGSPASAFASTIVRWATVNADGTIIAAQSQGITQDNITHPSAGFYCLTGLDPVPTAATATRRFGGTFGQIFVEVDPGGTACSGAVIGISTYNNSNGAANNPFTVVVY